MGQGRGDCVSLSFLCKKWLRLGGKKGGKKDFRFFGGDGKKKKARAPARAVRRPQHKRPSVDQARRAIKHPHRSRMRLPFTHLGIFGEGRGSSKEEGIAVGDEPGPAGRCRRARDGTFFLPEGARHRHC
jgi:hypothetical protein